MKCPKCKDEYNDDIEICADCLIDLVPDDFVVTENTELEQQQDIQGMTVSDEIKAHLEFLGFKIENHDDSFKITHANFPYSMNCNEFEHGFIFEVILKVSDNALKLPNEYFEFINQCNNDIPVCRVLHSIENNCMIVDSWFLGNYDKMVFESFIKIVLSEINIILNKDNIKDWIQ